MTDVEEVDEVTATSMLVHGTSTTPMGRRETLTSFMATWASQIGITLAFALV